MENSFVSKVSLGREKPSAKAIGILLTDSLARRKDREQVTKHWEGGHSANYRFCFLPPFHLAGDYKRPSTVNVPNVRGTRRDSCIRRLPVPPSPPHLPAESALCSLYQPFAAVVILCLWAHAGFIS